MDAFARSRSLGCARLRRESKVEREERAAKKREKANGKMS